MNNTFLGVTNSNKWESLERGSKTYWCVFKKFGTQPNDLIALHKTKLGIIQIYRVTDVQLDNSEFECELRNMLTVATELVLTLENPIVVKDLRANPILQKSGPVERNFQATIFILSSIEWNEFIRIASQKNPEQSIELLLLVN